MHTDLGPAKFSREYMEANNHACTNSLSTVLEKIGVTDIGRNSLTLETSVRRVIIACLYFTNAEKNSESRRKRSVAQRNLCTEDVAEC